MILVECKHKRMIKYNSGSLKGSNPREYPRDRPLNAGKTSSLYLRERVRTLSGRQSRAANQLFGRMADIGRRRILHRPAEFGNRADLEIVVAAPANLDFKFI